MSISDRDFETLSAYMDDELSGKALARFEARLQTNQDLQDAYEQLQRTRTVMRSLPKLRAPRNYILTPEMVGIAQKPTVAFPILRLASVLATLLLIVVFMGDLFMLPNLVKQPSEVQFAESAIEDSDRPAMEAEIVESQLPEAPMEGEMDRAMIEEEAPPAAAEAIIVPEAESAPEADSASEADSDSEEESASEEEESAPEADTLFSSTGAAPVEELANDLGGLAEPAEEPQLKIETRSPEPQTAPDERDGIDLLTVIRMTEIALMIFAISTGLTAFYLYRKYR